jgi:predicted PurR-regulated permease PerM
MFRKTELFMPADLQTRQIRIDVTAEQFTEEAETVESAVANGERPVSGWPLIMLAWIAVVGALYVARDLIIPVILALFLALLLMPLLRRLRRFHIPDVVSSFVMVTLIAGLFTAGLVRLAGQGRELLAKTPEMLDGVQAMLPKRSGPIGDFAKAMAAVRNLTQPAEATTPMPVVVHSTEATTYTVLGTSGHVVGAALIVFVLAFFILSFSDTLLKQAVESRTSFSQKRNVVQLLHNIENGISRYLGTITLINAGLGVASGVLLWVLGVPNPALWAVVVGTLNFVPHIGAFACMVVLFLVGSVAHQSLSYGLGIAAAFAVVSTAESYLVTPLILSRSLQLSPLAVILSVLFWGWLWGITGGLMAAPLLAVLKIICDQSESLRPWGIILSGKSAADANHA